MALVVTNDGAAGAQFQSVVQAAGLDVSHLGAIAQLQAAVAQIYTYETPSGALTASSITLATAASGDALVVTGSAAAPASTVRYIASPNGSASNLSSNVPSGGQHSFRIAGALGLSVAATTLTMGAVGAAFTVAGTTTALSADQASGAITYRANVGTGTGSVGGFIFQVPITHGSDSVAQTLTTVLTLDATTTVRAVFAGSLRAANVGIGKAATATSPLCITGLPTSSAGLASGDIWANSNVLTIVP